MIDWIDTAHRTFWTFLEAFVGALAATYSLAVDGAAILSAIAAGVAAAIVPLKQAVLVKRNAAKTD